MDRRRSVGKQNSPGRRRKIDRPHVQPSIPVLRDLRVSKQARTLESKYGGLLESLPDAIVLVTHTGRIVLINEQAEALFGYTRKELLGKTIEILLPERFREKHAEYRTRYFAEPKTRTMGAPALTCSPAVRTARSSPWRSASARCVPTKARSP